MLESIVLQQKEEIDLLLKKDYQERISKEKKSDLLQSKLIKWITGPRSAGKSMYAAQLLNSQSFAYLNFDDELLLQNFDEKNIMLQLMKTYLSFRFLLLDEIQNLPDWDIWVGKLYQEGINLVITSSSANLLSSERTAELKDHCLQISIFPFTFKEAIEYKYISANFNTREKKAELMQHLVDYLQQGGFPETIKQRNITRNYLNSLFNFILKKEIRKRYKLRNHNDLNKLANYLLANFCNQLSIGQLSNDLHLGSAFTIKRFCSYLSDSYLFFFLPRFNSKLKLARAPLKIYTIDSGFIFARLFESMKYTSRLLENLVFVELLRREYIPGETLFYYRTRNDKEVHFVCRTEDKVSQLIHVSSDLSNSTAQKREVLALQEASRELNCNDLLMLTYDKERTIEENGYSIRLIPTWKWLLNEYLPAPEE
ncbi:MAG: ATP-binding protein [Candidatus Azobacteroides sp.]|nr:ATP-binding protein [Candidatus Azobacteroides sp.]